MIMHTSLDQAAVAKQLAGVYRALAHPVRLQLLHVLLQEEACVCHLTCMFRRQQPYISQQLGILRDAGLLADRRDGQVIYYRVALAGVADLIAAGQRILEEQGMPVSLPDVRLGRLAGCHCPACDAQA